MSLFIGQNNYLALVLVLRHSTENCSILLVLLARNAITITNMAFVLVGPFIQRCENLQHYYNKFNTFCFRIKLQNICSIDHLEMGVSANSNEHTDQSEQCKNMPAE